MTVLQEERTAAAAFRRMRQLHASAERAANRRRQHAINRVIAETKALYPNCRCGLHRGITQDELRALGAGCTGSRPGKIVGWVCPRLDAVRRRLGL